MYYNLSIVLLISVYFLLLLYQFTRIESLKTIHLDQKSKLSLNWAKKVSTGLVSFGGSKKHISFLSSFQRLPTFLGLWPILHLQSQQTLLASLCFSLCPCCLPGKKIHVTKLGETWVTQWPLPSLSPCFHGLWREIGYKFYLLSSIVGFSPPFGFFQDFLFYEIQIWYAQV